MLTTIKAFRSHYSNKRLTVPQNPSKLIAMKTTSEFTYKQLEALVQYDLNTGQFLHKAKGVTSSYYLREIKLITNNNNNPQLAITANGKRYTIAAHKLAWYIVYREIPTLLITHKDGNIHNNAISNLELTTNTRIQHRAKKTKISKYGRGVHKNPGNKKFTSSIKHQGYKIYLGTFDTIKEASRAYEEVKAKLTS